MKPIILKILDTHTHTHGLGLAAVFYFFAVNGISATEKLCKSPQSFDYLLTHSQTYYSENYACFFATFNNMAEIVKKDNKAGPTKKFLSLAGLLSGNAEVREAFSEVVEDLALNQTELFLKVAHTLDKDSTNALSTFLKNPNFVNKGEIQKRFSPYFKNPQFKNFIEKTR